MPCLRGENDEMGNTTKIIEEKKTSPDTNFVAAQHQKNGSKKRVGAGEKVGEDLTQLLFLNTVHTYSPTIHLCRNGWNTCIPLEGNREMVDECTPTPSLDEVRTGTRDDDRSRTGHKLPGV